MIRDLLTWAALLALLAWALLAWASRAHRLDRPGVAITVATIGATAASCSGTLVLAACYVQGTL